MRKLSIVLLICAGLILTILNFFRIDSFSHSASDTLRPFIIQTLILLGVVYFVFRGVVKKMK